jgi:hypothetical protein
MENLHLVFSINCLTGSYHKDNNFTMSWLTNTNGGAYCVIATTDVSYSGYNEWMSHGLYTAFLSDYNSWHNSSTTPDWTADLPEPTFGINDGRAVHLGEMLDFAKMYMFQYYGTDNNAHDTFQGSEFIQPPRNVPFAAR